MKRQPVKIIPCYCSKCSDYLAGVPVGSKCYCPNCNLWSVAIIPTGKAKLIDYAKPKTINFERCDSL
jgi:hypothetical protein